VTLEPVVPIAALEHHAYCARQCALIHVDGVWSDNVHTVRGSHGHRRADAPGWRAERGRLAVRSLPLWSEALGLSGRADVVEFDDRGRATPIEFKIGKRHGDAAHLQLCAQAFCLEEMLEQRIDTGYIWFSAIRRRTKVSLEKDLRQRTLRSIQEVRATLTAGRLPPPVDDARCAECQLLGHCLPQVSARPREAQTYMEREVFGCGF
jgi:CRISPR-associated exonuclease Cas4